MKISLLCHLLFPGDKYRPVAYPIQTAMNLFWGISNEGHLVQLINASDPIEKIIIKLKSFHPDMIYNLSEGLTSSPTRLAFFPELFKQLKIPYIGSDSYLLTTSLNKHLSKKIVAAAGIKTPKSNLFYLDANKKQQLGKWRVKFPIIVKPNFRGDSEGITQDSVVQNIKDLKRVLNKRLKQFPEGVLVEQYIEGREIGVCYLEGFGENNVLFPAELVINKKLTNPYNIIDYHLKNYATKNTTIQNLSIRLADDLPSSLIRKIQNQSKKIFDIFQVKDFCRIDFRVTSSGDVYFLELTPDLTMLGGTHPFFVAKEKHKLTFGEVLDHIIKRAAKRWGLRYYRNNKNLLSKVIYKLNRKYYAVRYGKLKYLEE